jgi:hypothetical protein
MSSELDSGEREVAMAWSWKKMNAAKKTMIRRSLVVVVAYELLWSGAFAWVYYAKLEGKILWALAAAVTLPVLGLIWTMARYLGDEVDEFHRQLVVRCLLWGTAGVMTSVCFHGLLQLLGWKGRWSAGVELGLFFLAALGAKLTYRVQHRVPDDVDAVLEGGAR